MTTDVQRKMNIWNDLNNNLRCSPMSLHTVDNESYTVLMGNYAWNKSCDETLSETLFYYNNLMKGFGLKKENATVS
jgi:hypothetical protein